MCSMDLNPNLAVNLMLSPLDLGDWGGTAVPTIARSIAVDSDNLPTILTFSRK